ncbi:E3 ubiquitin-protein ligase CCNB1IP1 [Elsinoe australis]|uniref:E3 ubiquitin-protein ligase CCNB1IP1 n=1 Tax=Elsinoe australis TaxID=40998 RepID=A0A2P8AFZ0_9PEZI|nr:E3 ubiquitin-protein ligase CCNB1IP1 [Elsinoe australis]
MAKQVSERYSELNTQANAMIEGANKEIGNLTARLEAAINDREELQKKNDELAAAFRGKGKSMAQLQQLYNKLKAQVNTGYIEEAAAQTVDDMIYGAAGAYMGQPPQRPPQVHTTVRSPGMFMNQRQAGGGSGGSDGNATPVQHRERLGVSPHTRNASAHGHSGVNLGHNILQPTPARVSLRSIDPNLTGGIASGSQGMSAGAKMGRQTGGYPGGRNAATGTRNMGPPFLRI